MSKLKLGVLFSGGKDSMYAAYIEKQKGNEISCLISIFSENNESFMFHTPSIRQVEKQAKVMGLPLVIGKTKGKKEEELVDLASTLKKAKEKFKLDGIVTGALASNYQAERIKKICNDLDLECLNPLWGKDQIELLHELVKNKFDAIVVGVFAYPLTKEWLGRKIDFNFIEEMKKLSEKYKINPAGEGGEIESFVLNCALFSRALNIKSNKISGEKNSWRMDLEVE